MGRLLYDWKFGYGVRSCRDGGRWTSAEDERGRPYLKIEASALRACVSDPEWEDMLADLQALMSAAEQGKLVFDSTYTKGIVCHAGGRIAGVGDVLEARIERTFNLEDQRRHVRLYFSEPAGFEDVLLFLGLQHKGDGEPGLEEQNEHIREAQRRFDRWWKDHYHPMGGTT